MTDKNKTDGKHDPSKRRFVKTAAYVAPAIVTMSAIPSFASAGSGRYCDPNRDRDRDS